MRRFSIHLPVAAIILTTALAIGAEPQRVPFKGVFEGTDAHDILPPGATSVDIHTNARGTGVLLGQFSLQREITGNLVNFSDAGTARWIAANQDTIYTTIAGSAAPADIPGYLKVTETHTITGGTGRFTGAQGTFTVELFHKFEPSEVVGAVEKHDIFGSFSGTITSPAAPR